MAKYYFTFFWLATIASQTIAEVAILKFVQTLYDRSPKLKIKGSGFEAPDHDIILELSATGQPTLELDKDFLITKDDDGLILKLLSNRRWVSFENRVPPIGLILSSVKFASDKDTNLLPDPILLANVLPTPSVLESDRVIYQTATNELRINGTGFQGAKKVELYFKPPLYIQVGYEIVSNFPLKTDQVILRLRHNYKWRDDPGELKVIGVDTGAGPAKVNGDDGIVVANVLADLDQHDVSVEATATDQLVYHNDPAIFIKGHGFNTQGTTLRFGNGILGDGVNYTTKSITSDLIVLNLEAGSNWRKNSVNLPGYLTLLAVNAGAGFVAVGPTNSGKGRDIATVFERPSVYSSQTKLFRTHSHELELTGVGFTQTGLGSTRLQFDPALEEGTDYVLRVTNRTTLVVTLKDGKSWRKESGPLVVMAINSLGGQEGWITLGGSEGVHVAEVVDDVSATDTGGVEIFPSGTELYQSAKQLSIAGIGFKEGMGLSLDPELKDNDYVLSVASPNSLTLTLKSGKKWRSEHGYLVVKSVKIDDKSYNLGGHDGIRVANIYTDPIVNEGKDSFHESQSKLISIGGMGFTTISATKIVIRPTLPAAFKILSISPGTIKLQLKPGADWLPNYITLKGEDSKKIPLQVVSIDTGAGVVSYENNPITVGFIVKDREGVVCDDSCEFAFDGICDDGRTNDEDYHYEDDDLGGSYGEEQEPEDDYYATDSYKVSPCVDGTDCTDCGGVDKQVDYDKLAGDPASGIQVCTNTCAYARDGVCDDPRGANYCEIGTDCEDCGPVGASNFSVVDDDTWFDDDDDYWSFNDGNFLSQTGGLAQNWDKVKRFSEYDGATTENMFLLVLEAMAYTVAALFITVCLFVAARYYFGYKSPCISAFEYELSERDLELAPTRKMQITPDVVRT